MTIRNNDELYRVITQLCQALSRQEAHAEGRALNGTLGISTLAGEGLGELRHQLICIRKSDVYRGADVHLLVEEAIEYINSALGPQPKPS